VKDVSAVNWGAISGIARDRGIIAVINSDGNRLVHKSKVPLNANSFVISLCRSMEAKL
jgi:hypothetical protein